MPGNKEIPTITEREFSLLVPTLQEYARELQKWGYLKILEGGNE
jgi:hypothetical protein